MFSFLSFLNFARHNRRKISKKYLERFIQDIDYIELKKGKTYNYKYKMIRDRVIPTRMLGFNINHDFFNLNQYGLLIIKDDYMWDGPSGPTIDTASFMRSSACHDVMFQILREELIPFNKREAFFKTANEDLRRISREDGMLKMRSNIVFYSVSNMGGRYTIK